MRSKIYQALCGRRGDVNLVLARCSPRQRVLPGGGYFRPSADILLHSAMLHATSTNPSAMAVPRSLRPFLAPAKRIKVFGCQLHLAQARAHEGIDTTP